jgi:hypothetical protein
MNILIIIILPLFITVLLIKKMIVGRGILFPDFQRIDKFYARKNIITKWDSRFGRFVYYFGLVLLILSLILITYII